MVKAVIFDMFETLVSLFEGRTYFSEHMAADLGLDADVFRKAWHTTEEGRSCGTYTIEEGARIALEILGSYQEESVSLIAKKRRASLEDTFQALPQDSVKLLSALRKKGCRIGLISNCYSDECEYIKNSALFPFFDAAMLSYEQGVCKPDPVIFTRTAEALGAAPQDCMYVGDGGSNELFVAKEVGMQAVQTRVFSEMAYEPHVPCGFLPEFPHIEKQEELLKLL